MLVDLLVHHLLPLLSGPIVSAIILTIDILARAVEVSTVCIWIALAHIDTSNGVIVQFLIS